MKAISGKTDMELVAGFRAGNNRALEILITRHKDKIYTSILILVKDRNLANDLFQDVFIKIVTALRAGRYNNDGCFCAWCIRIAHNYCIDHFRNQKRVPVNDNGGDDDIFEDIENTHDNGEQAIIKNQQHQMIRKMVNLLPADQREVVVLRHFADMLFKEIAELTGTSRNTALGRMRYALQNLRKLAIKEGNVEIFA